MSEKSLENSNLVPSSRLAKDKRLRVLIFEAVGCFALSTITSLTQYTIPVIEKAENPYHSLFIALTYMMCMVWLWDLSGAHLNLCVSVVRCWNERRYERTLHRYIIGQIIGGIIGALYVELVSGCAAANFTKDDDILSLLEYFSRTFVGEFMLLMFLQISLCEETTFIHENYWQHIYIAVCYYTAHTYTKTRLGLNPSISIPLQLISAIFRKEISYLTVVYSLIDAVSALAGATLSYFIFSKLYVEVSKKWREITG